MLLCVLMVLLNLLVETVLDLSLIHILNQEFVRLGISQSIDYEKYYLYSLITHSSAIEGSTPVSYTHLDVYKRQMLHSLP